LIAAYARVSSAAQSAGMQREAIARAAHARGDVVGEWYVDTFSGGTLARPELARLRANVRAGLVRKLYVYRLDRLTRSGIRDTLDVVDELRAHGCELVTLADGFDMGGPAAEVILAVLAWAAKVERLSINERIAAAREHGKAIGRPWGRPRRLSADVEARIAELAGAGHTVRYIATATHTPRATVARCLKNMGRKATASDRKKQPPRDSKPPPSH
jgi:DNA invertase Pin-like site-specific DNA recombinase